MNLDEIFNNSFEKKVIDSNLVSQRIKECRDLVIDKFSDIEFIEEGHIYKIDEIEYSSGDLLSLYPPFFPLELSSSPFLLRDATMISRYLIPISSLCAMSFKETGPSLP